VYTHRLAQPAYIPEHLQSSDPVTQFTTSTHVNALTYSYQRLIRAARAQNRHSNDCHSAAKRVSARRYGPIGQEMQHVVLQSLTFAGHAHPPTSVRTMVLAVPASDDRRHANDRRICVAIGAASL